MASALEALASPRAVSLVALCTHLSVLSVVIHLSRSPERATAYHASSAVLFAEIGKLVLSFVFVIYQAIRDERGDRSSLYLPVPSEEHEGDASLSPSLTADDLKPAAVTEEPALSADTLWSGVAKRTKGQLFGPQWQLLAIPALLFTAQNNLQYLALAHLSVPVFQVFTQLKVRPLAATSYEDLHACV